MNKNVGILTNQQKHILYAEYGVHNEKELSKKLFDDSLTLPCGYCNHQINIQTDRYKFVDDIVVCWRHFNGII